jgi:hypothetical protein
MAKKTLFKALRQIIIPTLAFNSSLSINNSDNSPKALGESCAVTLFFFAPGIDFFGTRRLLIHGVVKNLFVILMYPLVHSGHSQIVSLP